MVSVVALCSAADGVLGCRPQSGYKADFAIPDMPAFRALGIEPDNILRPSDPKSFAVMLSGLSSNFSVVPQSFAAEFAPLALLNAGSMTLRDYRKAPFLYRTRLSVGTRRSDEQSGRSDIAAGMRMTFLDKGDLKTDLKFEQEVLGALDEYADVYREFQQRFRREKGVGPRDFIGNPGLCKQESTYVDSMIGTVIEEKVDIDAIRDRYKQENWNSAILDGAYAVLLSTPDSLLGNVAVASHTAWLTLGLPLGSAGQLLVGANCMMHKPAAEWLLSFSESVRFYGGGNNLKGFAEAQHSYDGRKGRDVILASCGGEFMFMSGSWLEFSVGYETSVSGQTSSRFVSNLKYQFTLPEEFTAF